MSEVTIIKLAEAFQQMYKGLNKSQLVELEEELLKVYPSSRSSVLLSSDYDEEKKFNWFEYLYFRAIEK